MYISLSGSFTLTCYFESHWSRDQILKISEIGNMSLDFSCIEKSMHIADEALTCDRAFFFSFGVFFPSADLRPEKERLIAG